MRNEHWKLENIQDEQRSIIRNKQLIFSKVDALYLQRKHERLNFIEHY